MVEASPRRPRTQEAGRAADRAPKQRPTTTISGVRAEARAQVSGGDGALQVEVPLKKDPEARIGRTVLVPSTRRAWLC